jgi:uncharacterized phiE125 gp8 family phage protein
MSLVRTTAPTQEPLSLAEARLHLRLEDDFSDDDALVTSLITAARAYVEKHINQPVMPQAWRLTLDCFPCEDVIDLGMPGVDAVSSFSYVDPTGANVSFPSFVLDGDAFPSRVVRSYGIPWPTTRVQRNAVTISFTCSGLATDEREAIKSAMKLLIGQWYENREALIETRYALNVPFSVDALLGPYRRPAMEMA